MPMHAVMSMKKHNWFRITAMALIIGLTISWSLVPGRVQAASTSEALADAKDKQAQLEEQQAKLAGETNQLSSQVDKLTGELAWLNDRSDEQKKLYQEKTEQLQAAVADMEKAYTEYIQSEQDLQDKQNQYVERMQTMFAHQKKSVLQVFLESESLQGFFTTMQFMTIIADSDQQMIDDLEVSKDNAALKRDQAQQHSADMSAVVTQLEADIATLKANADAKQSDLNQTQLQLSSQEQQEDALNDESAKIAAEVADLQKKLVNEQAAATAAAKATKSAQATAAAKATAAAQAARVTPAPSAGNSAPNGKGWVWPYPGDRTVYSSYGMRYHPIYHVNRFHSGVDLGGDYGHPILAAADGVVLLVRNSYEGQNTGGGGYGNYIVISHDDGISTLYGHLKNTLVKAGQTVSAGDKIATCGSTGASTGPHLHFEVMIDGSTVNPVPYIS
ncbi:MAG: peptidoglycan DD-metalloendopeptidase family protein [Clostridiaceae bacterium]|nr:peptidoglycan DD-metalloendopeptidase family protein [Clostridiaceae bacterium]